MQYYTVFGQRVGSHILAMATLGTLSVVSTLALRGGDKGDKVPPIQASSGDEERFIKEFLVKAESEKKSKH